MGEMSLVFHVASALVVVVLIYLFLREQAILNYWRKWCASGSHSRVEVAEPLRALKVFSQAIGAGFESELPLNALQAVRTRMTELFRLHRESGICSIYVKNQSPPCVHFVLQRETSTIKEMSEQIRSELSNSIVIELTVAG